MATLIPAHGETTQIEAPTTLREVDALVRAPSGEFVRRVYQDPSGGIFVSDAQLTTLNERGTKLVQARGGSGMKVYGTLVYLSVSEWQIILVDEAVSDPSPQPLNITVPAVVRPPQKAMIPIHGNTFPVKGKLKALGGLWDSKEGAWMVPFDREGEALAIVASQDTTPTEELTKRQNSQGDNCIRCNFYCPIRTGRIVVINGKSRVQCSDTSACSERVSDRKEGGKGGNYEARRASLVRGLVKTTCGTIRGLPAKLSYLRVAQGLTGGRSARLCETRLSDGRLVYVETLAADSKGRETVYYYLPKDAAEEAWGRYAMIEQISKEAAEDWLREHRGDVNTEMYEYLSVLAESGVTDPAQQMRYGGGQ